MTFKELQDDALDRLQYDNTQTSSGPRTRIKRFMNQWHRRVLGDPKFSKLRDSSYLFLTVAGTPSYGLPPSVGKIKRIFDASTNNPPLLERLPSWLRQDSRADLNQGTPNIFVPYGIRPIFLKPSSSGSGIWAVSSSASDTTQAVRMNAFRASGYPHSAGPTTLTGTSRVQIGTLTDYIDILKLFLSAVCVGDISFYDAAVSGNLLGVIPISALFAHYYLIQLYPVPSSVITYTVECQLAIPDMVQDTDIPLFPEDYHTLLSACARYEEYITYKKQLDTARLIKNEEIDVVSANMLDFLINHDSLVIIPDDGRQSRGIGSNLGGWYPVSRW